MKEEHQLNFVESAEEATEFCSNRCDIIICRYCFNINYYINEMAWADIIFSSIFKRLSMLPKTFLQYEVHKI